jgi:hypothetical protein
MGGSSSNTVTVGSKLAGMSIQTSLLGQVIPIGWGRGKLSCNLIDYLNFRAIPHTTTTTTGGGKGGGSSSTSTTDYTYTADVIMSLCDAGPNGIVGVNRVWKDSGKFDPPNALSQVGLSLMRGTSTQTAWPYLVSAAPTHALAYRNMAYVYAQAYDLGSEGVVANHSFEVDFPIQFNPGGSVYDAAPKDVLTDFLTNTNAGVPNWPSSANGDWTNWNNYCLANNLLLSPVLDTGTAANQFIQRLLDQTHSDCFFSEGLLKVVPLGDTTATGNGVTWNPDLTPIVDLTEDDFLGEVQLEVMDQTDAYNRVQIQFPDRTNEYNTGVAVADDLDNIIQFGLRQQDPQTFNDICDPQIAMTAAHLWLNRQLYIRDQYSFDLPEDVAVFLEPRDYVTLTTTVDGMQLDRKLVSILSIDESEDGHNVFHIVAEGVPGHTANAALYSAHSATGFSPDQNADPGDVATPFIFNVPESLVSSVTTLEVGAAVAGVNDNWGGCFVFLSFDGTNYSQVGQITGPSRYGGLTATLASHADPDTTNTLSVDLSISKGALGTYSHTTADQNATLCLIRDAGGSYELISYGTATLTSANHYDLTYLRRAQFGSTLGAHTNTATFARLDQAIFTLPFDVTKLGQTVYIKFQSYNIYHRALQDLSVCTAYSFVLAKAGAVPDMPTGLALTSGSSWVGPSMDIICDPANRATSYRFDIYKSDGTTLLRQITSSTPSASYTTDQAALDGAQRSYKLAVTAINDSGPSTTTSQISVSNSAPATLSSPSTTGGTYTGQVTATASSDPDLAGYIVFFSPTSGFNPKTTGGVVVGGTLPLNIYGLAAGTYYCRIAAYDPWTNDPDQLNLSTELNFVISTGGGASPSGGGTDGGYDGNCVVEDTPILMAKRDWRWFWLRRCRGAEKPMNQCRPGIDWVWTRHEATGKWGAYQIDALEFVLALAYRASGFPDATAQHHFSPGDGDIRWIRMGYLGDILGMRIVGKMRVKDAHTYVAAGVLSHNIRKL